MYIPHLRTMSFNLLHLMSVCLSACLSACMPACLYACCLHACVRACVPACVHACMHVCMYVCMYVGMQARSHGGAARGAQPPPLEKCEPPRRPVPFAVTIGIEVYPPPPLEL